MRFVKVSWDKEVPDPYYGGIEGFEQVHAIFERTSPHILQWILSER
jgi:protein-tyrosine phosphatase